MVSLDEDFIQDQRRKAVSKWRWRNPYLAALLAFIHPVGMLFTSVPVFFVYLVIWLAMWVWWSNRPFGIAIAVGFVFAVYAYYQTLWKNAAIEKWKYGLPGTGKQNPKKLDPIA